MAHWRDGGIGGMAGSDDRPLQEYTLMERLSAAADGRVCGMSADALAEAAFNEIERLRDIKTDGLQSQIDVLTRQLGILRISEGEAQAQRDSALFKLELITRHYKDALALLDEAANGAADQWQPIDTAPVPPRDDFKNDDFHCLIQTKDGTVMEGSARWVQANGSNAATRKWVLRWYDREGYWLGDTTRYWMPLPAPRVEV